MPRVGVVFTHVLPKNHVAVGPTREKGVNNAGSQEIAWYQLWTAAIGTARLLLTRLPNSTGVADESNR